MNTRALAVEFIGTFFLVLTIGLTALAPGVPGGFAPLAIGAILIAMVYAGGHISGAHYNPAVTLAACIRGAIPHPSMPPYIAAQVIAAVVAGIVAVYIAGDSGARMSIDPGPALIGEFLFTFALCTVVLMVATARATSGNQFFGVAIGVTVVAGAYAMGGISGGAFNPAVAIALAVMKIVKWSDLWIHLGADFAGAAAAGLACKALLKEPAPA